MKLVVATHNEGKLVEIRRILEEDLGADAAQVELVSRGSLGLPTRSRRASPSRRTHCSKARFVAGLTGLPAIADDSGLIVDVMGQRAWHPVRALGGEHGNDPANNALLLAQLSDIPDAARTAVSAAPPHWPCRIPRPLWRAGGTPSSPKPSKSAKCRGASCARRAASMVSATTRCSCRTTSRSGPLRTIR